MNTKVDFTDIPYIKQVIKESNNMRDVVRNLGYYHSNHDIAKRVRSIINEYNISTEHFNYVDSKSIERWDNLPNEIHNCYSIADVLRSVGLTDKGNNHKTAKKYIKIFNLNTDHFLTKNERRPKNKLSNDDMFVEHSSAQRSSVRSRVLDEQLIDYSCTECDNKGEWLGKEIRLQLDHINGISNDNRLENLRFLCPNCHTQTETWGRKKR